MGGGALWKSPTQEKRLSLASPAFSRGEAFSGGRVALQKLTVIESACSTRPCDKTANGPGNGEALVNVKVKKTVGKARGEAWATLLLCGPVRQRHIACHYRRIFIVPKLFKKCPRPERKLPEGGSRAN